MSGPLHVLVIGKDGESNVCSVFRTSMFIPHLAELGVEIRFASPAPPPGLGAPLVEATEAMRSGASEFHAGDFAWADVVVFRRVYRTHIACVLCDFRTWDIAEARAHGGRAGHHVEIGPEWLIRPLFERFEADPESLGGRGLVYETDDDLLDIPPANGLREMYLPDLDLVGRMARVADVVTASTPVLAARLRRFSERVRVIRNAIDPDWYGPPPATRPAGYPRILYFGSSGRLRDYEVCREAVDAAVAHHPGARRVWLGAPDHEGRTAPIRAVADEVLPYVVGVPAFCRSLNDAAPDVGVAPLLDGAFERAKSELHWLDYSMAGAATVASRSFGDGPYRVIRPGVDGLLARSKRDWRDALERLASSKTLRDELAGRARERVLAEYHVRVRAEEWAAAYRCAAEHAGQYRETATPVPAAPVRPRHPTPSPVAPVAAPPTPPSAADVLAAYVSAQKFAGRSPLHLQVGYAGAKLPGWVTIDASSGADVQLDPAFGLPFADGSVDAIYARNELADLGAMAMVLFREAARTLRPGGAMRLVTRDRSVFLERRARLALQGVVLRGADAVTPAFEADTLLGMLVVAGFASTREAAPHETAHAVFAGADAAAGRLPKDDLLIIEAVR